MDCITAYMAGFHNVLATSGTAFTEMQVRLLSRYTKKLLINFDPDTAGANAAEKSIAMLTEEDFDVRVVTLEAGLDPDRFIRERGIKAYVGAVEGARRHSDYLIDRAIHLFPPRTAEGKSKAFNYLLPHIRRVRDPILLDEFESDAAQKLGIDLARFKEAHKAARKRRDDVRPDGVDALNEAERVLLRAAASSPESRVCLRVFQALHDQPQWFDGLSVAPILNILRDRGPLEPLSAMSDPSHRALLAKALLRESREVELPEIEEALKSLQYLYLEALQRRVRADIAEAERRGDLAQRAMFMAEKLQVDRQMREADR
jgi:DNA primase